MIVRIQKVTIMFATVATCKVCLHHKQVKS